MIRRYINRSLEPVLKKAASEFPAVVLDVLRRPPVSDILSLSAYTPSLVETIPITSLYPLPTATV